MSKRVSMISHGKSGESSLGAIIVVELLYIQDERAFSATLLWLMRGSKGKGMKFVVP